MYYVLSSLSDLRSNGDLLEAVLSSSACMGLRGWEGTINKHSFSGWTTLKIQWAKGKAQCWTS